MAKDSIKVSHRFKKELDETQRESGEGRIQILWAGLRLYRQQKGLDPQPHDDSDEQSSNQE